MVKFQQIGISPLINSKNLRNFAPSNKKRDYIMAKRKYAYYILIADDGTDEKFENYREAVSTYGKKDIADLLGYRMGASNLEVIMSK